VLIRELHDEEDHMATPLNESTLGSLAESVVVPSYDRRALTAGIVHIGVGGFHRAHQAMYLDQLMAEGEASDWAIRGVGMLEQDRRMKDVLTAQDHLYTLVVKHADGRREARVIGSIIDYLLAPDDPEAAIQAMAAPEIKIVSLTITEGGYNIDRVTGHFDLGRTDVAADVRGEGPPRTVFGFVVEALRRRRERGVPPFTVQSCDNIPGNGDVARDVFGTFASARDHELGEWLRREVAFPNSMVDRITPVTTDDDRHELAERFGVEDGWPVVCEPFTQWVVEDHFGLGRPPWEQVGAQLVDDVEPYELMKLRLLNASHQAMCYFGYLAGYRYAHEAAGDEVFARFLLGYMENEGSPTLPPVPGVDLDVYRHELIERFANPEIRDTLARLCTDSSDRIPKWLLPVVRQQLATDGQIYRAAAVVASWARYDEGIDEAGEPIEIADQLAEQLKAVAAKNREDPTAFIADRKLFGDLIDDQRFVAEYEASLDSLHRYGATATLERIVERGAVSAR
jgi:mannitol 2-dehydrogenase